jgi:hypothetical protein
MQLTRKIAIAAGALTLGATGVAAAVTTPDEAEPGLTTASEKAGFEVPVGAEADPAGDEVTEVETEDAEADEVEAEGTGPVDNHGAEVSAVAKSDFETGREHGEAVSAIARTNGGGAAATSADDGDDDEIEDEDAEADDAAEAGEDASGEHGRP